jgi:hypothetical protein
MEFSAMTNKPWLIVLTVCATASGCAHKVESPSVAESKLTPNMVCNANRVGAIADSAPIVIAGSGFTPLPTNALAEPTRLILPTVEIDKTSDLPGQTSTKGSASKITFSGDPRGHLAGNVSWQSEEQMTIRVTTRPLVNITPGVYDVTVTNPDRRKKSTLDKALAVVPPPAITEIIPPAICVDQADQVITVNGSALARVDETDLPSITVTDASGQNTQFTPDSMDGCEPVTGFKLELCTSLKFTVKVNQLMPGSYKLVLTDPEPLSCASSDDIDLVVHAPPKVVSVAPATVCSGGSVLIATGEGFLPDASAELRCGTTAPVKAQAVEVSGDGKMATLTFGPGVTAGANCDVVFINADSCEDRPLPHHVVTSTDGPILFNVDPNVVYNGVNTKVLLYVTALAPPFSVKMWPTSGDPSAGVELTATTAAGKTTVIQATIPKDTATGDYDLQVNDQSGCSATMDHAVKVTDNLTVSSGVVTPSFGQADVSVPVTILLGTEVTSSGAPRAFLNPPGAKDPAVQLQSVTTIDTRTLTAVVPASTPAGTYDLVIVWPDGQVAVLNAAYTSVSSPPPVINDVVPQSIVDQSGQSIQIRGSGFDASSVTLRCNDGATMLSASASAASCDASGCTQTASVDGSSLAAGSVCVVRVTNADGSYGEFSAIGVTNSSLNLSAPVQGKELLTARRALVSAAVKATSAARFLYAIGGDSGQVSGALSSVEFAAVDVFGNMNEWSENPRALGSARSFAGTATIGRYVYVFGGNGGAGALDSAERALVLSPEEIPVISNLDLCLAGANQNCFGMPKLGAGLDAGVYSYRVAAVIDDSDPENLGGETLASDPIILRLRVVNDRKITVKIDWAAPQDKLGVDLSGISGYRVYRTPKDGNPGADEALLAELSGSMLSFVDDGTKMLASAKPLPQGSTSAWQALPKLATKREGPAGAAARDPADPNKWYVYSLLGRDGATGHASYEYLGVTLQPNGRQLVGSAWTTGAQASAVGRWQFGAWTVDSVVSNRISSPTETWVYLGAGLLADGSTQDGRVEAGKVQAGGELGAFADDSTAADTVEDFTAKRVGYGTAAAAGSLFVFGGKASQVTQNATAATFIMTPPALAKNSWNNEGLSMTQPRYLMGSAIQSAFIFLVGGDTGSGITKTTETVVW